MIPVFSASPKWTLIYTKSNAHPTGLWYIRSQMLKTKHLLRSAAAHGVFRLRLREARLAQILFWISRWLLFAAWFCLDPVWHRLAVFFHQRRTSTWHGQTRTARRIQTVCVWLARSPYLPLPSSSFRWRRGDIGVVSTWTFIAESLTISVQPGCAITCIDICAHVKNPKRWQSYRCLDTRKYSTHW